MQAQEVIEAFQEYFKGSEDTEICTYELEELFMSLPEDKEDIIEYLTNMEL